MRPSLVVVAACLIGLCGCGQSAVEACIERYAPKRKVPGKFFADYDPSIHMTSVTWDGPAWPPLPTSRLSYEGSGVAGYAYAYRVGNGAWSNWHTTDPKHPELTLSHSRDGARIMVLVRARDTSGHLHPPVAATVTAHVHPVTVAEEPGECGDFRLSE
jgi:hypothetical protein